MARYIDADELKLKIRRTLMPNVDFDGTVPVEDAERFFLSLINKQPTADVEEVKHSEWKLYNDGSGVCKNCKTHQRAVWDIDNIQRFCIRCGAKMDGGN